MNIFRLTGDLSHLAAIIILLLKIWKTRSCSGMCIDIFRKFVSKIASFFAGISGKSQILFTIVYITRYLDLFTNFVSVYNTFMKVCFFWGNKIFSNNCSQLFRSSSLHLQSPQFI